MGSTSAPGRRYATCSKVVLKPGNEALNGKRMLLSFRIGEVVSASVHGQPRETALRSAMRRARQSARSMVAVGGFARNAAAASVPISRAVGAAFASSMHHTAIRHSAGCGSAALVLARSRFSSSLSMKRKPCRALQRQSKSAALCDARSRPRSGRQRSSMPRGQAQYSYAASSPSAAAVAGNSHHRDLNKRDRHALWTPLG